MKKVRIFILCLMLLPAMMLTGFASDDILTVSDANGKPGDVVFLTVTMNEAVSGDTLGVRYTYDKEILKAVPASSSWSKKGALQDFGTKDSGVWAASSPMDLQGAVCVLAFAIKEDAAFSQTEVTCEITVRAGDQVVGDYTATATVTRLCDHSFGQWQNHDDAEHSRTCSSCEAEEKQSHQWDAGILMEQPDKTMITLQIFTCEVCGATDEKEIITPVLPTEPPAETNPPKETSPSPEPTETRPATTNPTEPAVTEPASTESAPTEPEKNNGQLESFIENATKKEEGHDHSEEMVLTEPAETENILDHDHEHDHGEVPVMSESGETEYIADHDHVHDSSKPAASYGAVFAVLAVIAVLAWIGLLLMKKKR